LIEAQNKKVSALKQHKKGLMQQLFPAEGEREPKLRFKAFSGEWEEKKIGDFFKTYSGGTPSTTNKKYYGGNIPFIRSGEIDKSKTALFLTIDGLKNSSAKLIKKGNVLYALYGANSGDVAISKIDGVINQAILCLHSEKASNTFLYYNLLNLKIEIINKFIQGGQGNLSGDIIKSLEVNFPKDPKEQQKIANTLSTLDSLIEAQNQQINHLKQHKKGLMRHVIL
jgi:type I restriction enzyme S subunit